MKSYEIDVRSETTGTDAEVFALLADASSWPRWAPMRRARVDQGVAGVGEVRRFGIGPAESVEEVVASRPNSLFSYRLLEGLPVHDYVARVELTPTDGGTSIRWHSTFRAGRAAGPPMRVFLRWFLQKTADGLAAETGTGAVPGRHS